MRLFLTHPYIASALATWVFNNIVTVLVSSLPAPTKDSSSRYVYWFKVANTVIGNLKRAQSTDLQNSPNWQAAMQAHVEKLATEGSNPNFPAQDNSRGEPKP